MKTEQIRRLIRECHLDDGALTPESVIRLHAFIKLRAQWARKHNLAGPAALRSPWEMDVIDGFALLSLLDDKLLVDVGSGSGVPALIVASLQPDRPVVIVEPQTKRVAFLRVAAAQLGLKAVRIERSRWPMALDGDLAVVSRAVISPDAWPALAASAGPNVHTIYRYLASNRPPMTLAGFSETSAVDYVPPGRGDLRIERWDR